MRGCAPEVNPLGRATLMPSLFLRVLVTRVFISYAREDYATAKRLFDDMARLAVEPWLDRECMLPGQRWESEIRKAVRESRFF